MKYTPSLPKVPPLYRRRVNAGHDVELLKNDTCQCVPIFKTLQLILSVDDNMRRMVDSETPKDDIIRSFRDGSVFSENGLYSSDSNALQINVYSDEFECANALGNKKGKYKTNGFYFTLGNLPRKQRSKLKEINLLTLCPAVLIKKYGYEVVLKPALDDLET
jgi:hypothetical protein